ncbi:hypothetical protein FBQ97_00885 [Acidobacteria bacterium ACD]|nr:hypothetical protein [Acidobacteria bacterium ACD]
MSTLAAWTCWAEDRSLALATVIAHVNLRRGGTPPGSMAEFRSQSAHLIGKSKPVSVDPKWFISQLRACSETELLRLFGICPATFRRYSAPGAAAGLMMILADHAIGYLTPIHNKLKHGPQVVIMTVADAASKRGLTPEIEIPGDRVRLLFEGARTQSIAGEPTDVRIAPFLLHEPHFLMKMFVAVVVPVATVAYGLGQALYEDVFQREVSRSLDPAVQEVFEEVDGGGWCRP